MAMKEALQHALNGADLVIHLGAGKCRELPLYLTADDRKIVLVEANSKVARELKAKTSSYTNVRVMEHAISGLSGEATLYVYNLPEHSSLRRPTGLLDYFPGLRVVEQVPVRVYAVSSVLAELNWDDVNGSCLVLDVPGEELSILEALLRDNMLERIDSLVLHCPHVPLFEGAGTRQAITELLDAAGFELLAEAEKGGSSSVLMLRRNEWKVENAYLQDRLLALETETAEKKAETRRLESERSAMQERVECLVEESSELRAALASKEAQLEAVSKENEQYKRDSERHKQLAAEERERIRLLREEHEAALREASERAHALKLENELLSKKREQGAETQSMQAELDEARRNMSIALRIQALRENDLKELQERYGKALEVTKRQDELLQKLRQRLTVAAEYLEQIKNDGSTNVNQQETPSLVRGLRSLIRKSRRHSEEQE